MVSHQPPEVREVLCAERVWRGYCRGGGNDHLWYVHCVHAHRAELLPHNFTDSVNRVCEGMLPNKMTRSSHPLSNVDNSSNTHVRARSPRCYLAAAAAADSWERQERETESRKSYEETVATMRRRQKREAARQKEAKEVKLRRRRRAAAAAPAAPPDATSQLLLRRERRRLGLKL